MAHTAHSTHTPYTHATPPATHSDMINTVNRAIDKHHKQQTRRRICSQSYNSKESYDVRNADAYIKYLWQTTHTPLINGIHHTPPRRPPQHTDYQPPEALTAQPATPTIATPHTTTSTQLCIVTDDTHTLLVAHCRVARTDYSVTIITRTREFRAERHTPQPTDTYTLDGTKYTGAELIEAARQCHAHIYKLLG